MSLSWGSYFLQRLSQTIFVVLASALVSFALFRYVGDARQQYGGPGREHGGARGDAPRSRPRRSGDPGSSCTSLRDALSGDLGVSYRFGVPSGGC